MQTQFRLTVLHHSQTQDALEKGMKAACQKVQSTTLMLFGLLLL